MLEIGNVWVKPTTNHWIIQVEGHPLEYQTPVATIEKALYLGRKLAQAWEVFFRLYNEEGTVVIEEDYRNFYL